MTKRETRILNRLRRGDWLIRRGSRWNWTNGTFEVISGRGVQPAAVDQLALYGLIEMGEEGQVARARQPESQE